MKRNMVGVPGSSGSGSSASGAERRFDVSNEHDLLQLLQFIRRGPFEANEKHALRDSVLDFAASKDDALLDGLSDALGAKGATLLKDGHPVGKTQPTSQQATSAAPAPAAPSGLGSSRPQPSFGATTTPDPAPQQNGASAAAPAAATVQPQQQEASPRKLEVQSAAPAQKDAAQSAPAEPAPEKDVSAAQSAPPPPEPPQPSAIPEPEKPQTPSQPATTEAPAASAAPAEQASSEATPRPTPAPAASAAAPAQDAPAAPAAAAQKEPLERIKEIKRKINEKVGNPVNLIDANNEIGREYMNALLNAMRVVGSGSADDTALALDRLEKAFAEVERSIQSGETVIGEKQTQTEAPPAAPEQTAPAQETPPAAPEQQPSVPPADGPSAIPSDAAPARPQSAPAAPQQAAAPQTASPEPSAAPAEPTQEAPAAPQSVPDPEPQTVTSAPATPTPEQQPTTQPKEPAEPVPAPTPGSDGDETKAGTPTPMQELAEDVKLPQEETKEAPRSVENQAAQSDKPLSIAAKLKQKQSSQQSLLRKRATELELQQEQQSSDPLHSNAVSAGLQQLLSEWKLFKSSGIFGTGPSGYEHPLYKQLSALPMSAIIAGRFEGATPEVKQSITDYMNGWRYEQGVVHEMNETFEHYLRRVVKEILDKQKAPKA